MKPRSKCVVHQEFSGRWVVCLRADNGKTLFVSESFAKKSEAMHWRDLFLRAARDPEYVTEDPMW